MLNEKGNIYKLSTQIVPNITPNKPKESSSRRSYLFRNPPPNQHNPNLFARARPSGDKENYKVCKPDIPFDYASKEASVETANTKYESRRVETKREENKEQSWTSNIFSYLSNLISKDLTIF